MTNNNKSGSNSDTDEVTPLQKKQKAQEQKLNCTCPLCVNSNNLPTKLHQKSI